jgi:hypothetical protein
VIDERALTERLDDAVSGASIDLHRLTETARRDGRRRVRRHRAVSVATTTLLTTAVLLGGGWVGSQSGPGVRPVPAPPPAAPAPPRSGLASDAPVPATGRATVAALAEKVTDLGPGTAADFAGRHVRPGALARGARLDTVGALRWTPDGGTGSVPVRVNVQDGWDSGRGAAFTCADPGRLRCQVTESQGRVVVAFEKANGEAVDRFTDVWMPDSGLRVRVVTTNAREIALDPTIVLDQPPLSYDDLATIGLDPAWGPTIPSRYVGAGRDLPTYRTLRPAR